LYPKITSRFFFLKEKSSRHGSAAMPRRSATIKTCTSATQPMRQRVKVANVEAQRDDKDMHQRNTADAPER
jgi:hypothetical protein